MNYRSLDQSTGEVRLVTILKPNIYPEPSVASDENLPLEPDGVYCEIEHYPLRDYISNENDVTLEGYRDLSKRFIALSYT
jgi:hypothetical protein